MRSFISLCATRQLPLCSKPQPRWMCGQQPQLVTWISLPPHQQQAWRALGWTEASWSGDGILPLTSHLQWDQLTHEQQAAAAHGLGWNRVDWDQYIGRDAVTVRSTQDTATPAAQGEKRDVAGAAWRAVKSSSVAIGGMISSDFGAIPAMRVMGEILCSVPTAIEATEDQVVVDGVETCLYLDDSGSMRMPLSLFRTPLDEAQRVVKALHPLLSYEQTRVLKFGANPTVISPRERGYSSAAVQMALDGSSGTTFLWKMIEDDVHARYLPGGGRLRLIVVTDGEDTDSPGEYRGMQGMDPLMTQLQAEGFDVEWHIIMLNEVLGQERYAALAAASGGTFLSTVHDRFDSHRPEVKQLLSAIESGNELDDKEREQRKQQYELEAHNGDKPRFGWYKALLAK